MNKKEYQIQYRLQHKDKLKEQKHKWYLNNKNIIIEKNNKYYIDHEDKMKECKKQYRLSHKDEMKEYRKRYWIENKNEREQYRIQQKYGITLEQKEQMIIEQNGKCAACGDFLGKDPRSISVDHDHITGKVRKIIHTKCNTALAFMDENVDKILKLVEYAKYCNTIK
jgi:hypothetical protein